MQGRDSAQQCSGVPPAGATATFRTGGAPTPGAKVIERLEATAEAFDRLPTCRASTGDPGHDERRTAGGHGPGCADRRARWAGRTTTAGSAHEATQVSVGRRRRASTLTRPPACGAGLCEADPRTLTMGSVNSLREFCCLLATLPMEVFMTTRRSVEATEPTAYLTVTLSSEDAVTTVRLSGELDLASESVMAETAEQLRTMGRREVVLDIARVRFCDARGLAAIVAFRRRMDDAGAGVTLRGADPQMVRLLRLTGLEHLLDSGEDLAASQWSAHTLPPRRSPEDCPIKPKRWCGGGTLGLGPVHAARARGRADRGATRSWATLAWADGTDHAARPVSLGPAIWPRSGSWGVDQSHRPAWARPRKPRAVDVAHDRRPTAAPLRFAAADLEPGGSVTARIPGRGLGRRRLDGMK